VGINKTTSDDATYSAKLKKRRLNLTDKDSQRSTVTEVTTKREKKVSLARTRASPDRATAATFSAFDSSEMVIRAMAHKCTNVSLKSSMALRSAPMLSHRMPD